MHNLLLRNVYETSGLNMASVGVAMLLVKMT